MLPVTAICLTILAVLAIAGGAVLTLLGAIGAVVGREFGDAGLRLVFAILGCIGLAVFIIGAACAARLIV